MKKRNTKTAPSGKANSARARRRTRVPKEGQLRARLVVAALLLDLREQAGWTVEELAARSRLTVEEIRGFEAGRLGTIEEFADLVVLLWQEDPGRALQFVENVFDEHAARNAPLTLEGAREELKRLRDVGLAGPLAASVGPRP